MIFDRIVRLQEIGLATYDPSGRSNLRGIDVAPDIEVRTSAADLKSGNDPVLAKALEIICDDPDAKCKNP